MYPHDVYISLGLYGIFALFAFSSMFMCTSREMSTPYLLFGSPTTASVLNLYTYSLTLYTTTSVRYTHKIMIQSVYSVCLQWMLNNICLASFVLVFLHFVARLFFPCIRNLVLGLLSLPLKVYMKLMCIIAFINSVQV